MPVPLLLQKKTVYYIDDPEAMNDSSMYNFRWKLWGKLWGVEEEEYYGVIEEEEKCVMDHGDMVVSVADDNLKNILVTTIAGDG